MTAIASDAAERPRSIYDFPEYYELSFGPDWRAEFRFLLAASERHVARPVRRVFEPACGTGRLLYRFAKTGHDALGIDLNPRAIDYCRARLRRRRLAGWLEVADMTDFQVPRAADLAYIMINSFRHLTAEGAAESHLRSMARAVAPGGVYIMAFHLSAPAEATAAEELWTSRRGKLTMITRLKTLERDLARRVERLQLTFDIDTSRRTLQLSDELVFRTYSAEEFLSLVASVPEWELAGLYDFSYNVGRPIVLDARTEDAVFVLRRR